MRLRRGAARATIVHYLGVIVPLLLGRPKSPDDRNHGVRFAIGAGVEPQLHASFETRFGFPLIEVWGMTEMVRVLLDNVEPRSVGTRSFGRPVSGIEVRVVDEQDNDVATGTAGELIIRHSQTTPRRDFFSGYLDDDEATAQAWRNGWFHTGGHYSAGFRRDAPFRRSEEEYHPAIRRKHRRRRGRGHPPGSSGGQAGRSAGRSR